MTNCVVCNRPVANGDGVYHADLRVRSHQGECRETLNKARRDYSRSRQGRWRSRAEVLRVLRAGAGDEDTVDRAMAKVAVEEVDEAERRFLARVVASTGRRSLSELDKATAAQIVAVWTQTIARISIPWERWLAGKGPLPEASADDSDDQRVNELIALQHLGEGR